MFLQNESKFLDSTRARYPSAHFIMKEIDQADKRDHHFTQERCAVKQGNKLDVLKTFLLMADEEFRASALHITS